MPPPKKAKHEMPDDVGGSPKPNSTVPRPGKHDSPDNPRVYGKPTVAPQDNLPMSPDVSDDTRPDEPSPYTGRTK